MRKPFLLLAILLVCCLLPGCNSLQVRVAEYSPPPISPELMLPCQEPEVPVPDLPDGALSFKGLYLLHLRDQEPWRACRANKAELIRAIQYRDKVQQDIRNLAQCSREWFQFWKTC